MFAFQIEFIKEESERLKNKIYDYQRELTNQIEAHNSKLMAKKEQLEQPQAKVRRLMRDSHVAEQLKQKTALTKQLAPNLDIDLLCKPIKKPLVVSRGEVMCC